MSDAKKEYSSTTGMQASVETSELLKVRIVDGNSVHVIMVYLLHAFE